MQHNFSMESPQEEYQRRQNPAKPGKETRQFEYIEICQSRCSISISISIFACILSYCTYLAVDEALALGLLGVDEHVVGGDFKVSGGSLVVDEFDFGLDALAREDLLKETLALPRARPVPSAATVLQLDRDSRHCVGKGGGRCVKSS